VQFRTRQSRNQAGHELKGGDEVLIATASDAGGRKTLKLKKGGLQRPRNTPL
jgi:hypothetical protein